MIISISAKLGGGKDLTGQIIQYLINQKETNGKGFGGMTCLEFLEQYKNEQVSTSWQIKKFADKLKDMVCMMLNCTREQLEDRVFKDTPLGEEWNKWKIKEDKGKISWKELYFSTKEEALEYIKEYHRFQQEPELIKMTPRLLMQLLGTEAGRNIIHPDLWCILTFKDYIEEKWVDIKDYNGFYQVSNFGNVRSIDRYSPHNGNKGEETRFRKGQNLKHTKTGNYLGVGLGQGQTKTIHSLVAKHFVEGEKPGLIVNHKDGNPHNNFYKNLEWITQAENASYTYSIGNGMVGEDSFHSKLKEKDVIQIKALLKENIPQTKIAKLFNISKGTISNIAKGKSWKYLDNPPTIIHPITPPKWIITDNRFPNEVKAVKHKNGLTLRIERDFNLRFPDYQNLEEVRTKDIELFNQLTHFSETALDNYTEFDYVIQNNGIILDLIKNIENILIKEKLL